MTAAHRIPNHFEIATGGIRNMLDGLFTASIMLIACAVTTMIVQPLWITYFVLDTAGLIQIEWAGFLKLVIACFAYSAVWGTIGNPNWRYTAYGAGYGTVMAFFYLALAVFGAVLNLAMWAVYYAGKFVGLF